MSLVTSDPSWMDPIWDYLIRGLLPSDPKEAAKLRTRLSGLLFIRDIFISEVSLHPSLSVLKEEMPTTYSRKYMKVYEETTSALVAKILRPGYY